jgi:two-component sensor histidine kinase
MIQDYIDQASFIAHGYCLMWQPWLVVLHAASDLLIAISYFAIPLAIWMYLARRPDVQLRGLGWLFAAFIVLCGVTHVFGLITLWVPIYHIEGIAKAGTALVSVVTAAAIFPLIPKALAIPSPALLQETNDQLSAEVASHLRTLAELEQMKSELEERLQRQTDDLTATRQQLAAVHDTSPDGFMMFDSVRDENGNLIDFRWTYANEAGAEVVGHSIDTLIGQHLLDVLPGNKKAGLFDAYRGVAETGEPWQDEVEYQHDDVDGWFRITAVKTTGGFAVSFSEVSARVEREQRLQLLMREVNHRSKNLLTIVQSIARQTATERPPREFADALSGRLRALAASQDLIVEGSWRNIALKALVRSQLEHLSDDTKDRIEIEGPRQDLSPAAAEGIGMAIYELSTNAIKYGALSTAQGRVSVKWRHRLQDDEAMLEISWIERGGPEVVEPTQSGFGRTVIERMPSHAVGGTISLSYDPDGLRWTLVAPRRRVQPKYRA